MALRIEKANVVEFNSTMKTMYLAKYEDQKIKELMKLGRGRINQNHYLSLRYETSKSIIHLRV